MRKATFPIVGFFLLLTVGYSHSVQALTFDFTTNNNSVVRNPSSFSLTVNGITATAQAFVGEWTGTHYSIFGPFPTGTGFTTANADGFLRGGEGFQLEEGPIGGIPLSGTEGCSGGGCAFDNGPYNSGDTSVKKFNFALISFSQPVTLKTSINLTASNYDHDFWLASNDTAPDLNQDFISAFSGFTKTVHDPLASFQGATGLEGVHQNLRFLAIGAPLDPTLGSFPGFENPSSLQLTDAFSITSLDVDVAPGPAPIPEPSTMVLFGSGLAGLLGWHLRQARKIEKA